MDQGKGFETGFCLLEQRKAAQVGRPLTEIAEMATEHARRDGLILKWSLHHAYVRASENGDFSV